MKLLREFSIVCLLAIIMMGTSIGVVLNGNIANNALEEAKAGTASTVSAITKAYFSKENLQKPKTGSGYDNFAQKLDVVVGLRKDILSIKYWNSDYVVTWAVDKNTIGKQFPKSKELTGAFLGNITSEAKDGTNKIKNMFLQNLNGTIKLYVPIRFSEQEQVSAVMEVHQTLKNTYIKVREEQIKLWYMLGSGFLCLYLSLLGIVWKAAKHVQELSKDVSENVSERIGLTDELSEAEHHDAEQKVPSEQEEKKENYENQIINKSAILEYAGGEKEILQAIIEAFIIDSEKLLAQISGAIKEEDSKALRAASHSLKKSLQDLSARAAYNAAANLENIGIESDICNAEEAYAKLEKEMERLRPELAGISREA